MEAGREEASRTVLWSREKDRSWLLAQVEGAMRVLEQKDQGPMPVYAGVRSLELWYACREHVAPLNPSWYRWHPAAGWLC